MAPRADFPWLVFPARHGRSPKYPFHEFGLDPLQGELYQRMFGCMVFGILTDRL